MAKKSDQASEQRPNQAGRDAMGEQPQRSLIFINDEGEVRQGTMQDFESRGWADEGFRSSDDHADNTYQPFDRR